ncbi:hypothetical protein KR222_003587 [Zaprionus bogoriensis]|nr:hypothetical protein KR222_003587 [Zaprionus bogoriensis]
MSEKHGQGKAVEEKLPWYYNLYNTIKETPINLTLLIVSAFVCYKVVTITRRRHKENRLRGGRAVSANTASRRLFLPSLHRDFTVKELREYNGTRTDGRILVAVNFNVYDVSGSKHFYGLNGSYPQYAGCDISRSLINFSAEKNEMEDFDELADLTESQYSTLVEWDQQYAEKYPFVGHLVPDCEKEPIILAGEEKTVENSREQFMM